MIIREATLSSQASKEMLRLTRIEQAELKPMRRSNSVDSLSPKSRFLNAMNTIPITPGVRYNTIIGDRGRGDSPNSSDGVVPYWSSHMNGAQSECIVPSGHGAHQDPQAIASIALRLSVSLLLIQGRVWRNNHAEIRTIVLFRLRSLVSKPSSIVLDHSLLSID
jgi:hypothetical protein